MKDRDEKRSRSGRAAGVVAASVLSGAMLVGAPAHAGNDFTNGFEDQLGRIAAVQVVRIGQVLLGAGLHPGFAYAAHPQGHTTVVVQGAPQTPCSGGHTSPAPYGERIVYERYERTVLPPPEPVHRGPTAPTHIHY